MIDGPRISRRGLAALTATTALAPITARAVMPQATPERHLVAWIDRHATPLRSVEPDASVHDLMPLLPLVGPASIVGLGESSHGTSTQFRLKHRVARFLVECLGFRTIAWEENWGSGLAIDRYVTTGQGDPRQLVAQAGFNLQSRDMLELARWMRSFNRGRPDADKVHFLGADVLELRAVSYDELRRHVADVAPNRLPELARRLRPIRFRNSPGEHFMWYDQQPESRKRRLVAQARAVYDLVRRLPTGQSGVSRDDAVQHAHAILGFHDSYSAEGDRTDARERYIAEMIERWRRRTGHRIVYSAANAHTAAVPRMTVSFPPDLDVRRMAGGRLRERYGQAYVSIGLVFQSGRILAGWDEYPPQVFDVPTPDPSFVDHVLGQARYADFLLDLRRPAPRPVREWLDGAATTRVIGATTYHANNDRDYFIRLGSWRAGFDAVLHRHVVSPTRQLTEQIGATP